MIINSSNLNTFFRGLQTIFNNAFAEAEPQWQKVATMVPSTTAQEDYGWLGRWPRLREWIGDRQVMNLAAHDYSLKNKKYEATIAVGRDELDDDQYGVYTPLTQGMGQAAAEHPDELTFTLLAAGDATLCYDGQNFFDTDHPVAGESVSNIDSGGANNYWFVLDTGRPLKPLIYQSRRPYDLRSLTNLDDDRVFMTDEFKFGVDARCNVGFGFWQMAYASNQALTGDNYEAVEAAMMAFKDDQGRPLNIRPTTIVVGPSNVAAARATFLVDRLANGAANPNYQAVEIVKVPWLD